MAFCPAKHIVKRWAGFASKLTECSSTVFSAVVYKSSAFRSFWDDDPQDSESYSLGVEPKY